MPLFSVIIPAYNRAGIIVRAIQSVLAQTCIDYELIVVDDGSTDNTVEVLRSWIEHNNLRYIYQENRGVCAARNAGASIATGRYLTFLDSDDQVKSNWLEDFKSLISTSDCDILFCSTEVIRPNGEIKKISCLDPYRMNGKDKGIALAGSWAMKARVFIEIGGYDESIRYGENTELKIRWNNHGLSQEFLDRCNLIYHESISGGSKQSENKLRSNLYLLQKHAKYFDENPRVKRLFLQVAAVSAVRLEDIRQGHSLFVQAWKTSPFNLKLTAQSILTLIPILAKKVWKPQTINGN
jgi:glycosyltransferase involved in cell wall biosynthesis